MNDATVRRLRELELSYGEAGEPAVADDGDDAGRDAAAPDAAAVLSDDAA